MALGWLWWRAWFLFVAVDAAAHFVWQAWRLATSIFSLCGRCGAYGAGLALVARLVPVCPRGRGGCLCGRRGIWKHRPPFCAAGVALGDIGLASVALMVLGWLWWRAWFPFVPEDWAAVCVAGVAFGSIGLHSLW